MVGLTLYVLGAILLVVSLSFPASWALPPFSFLGVAPQDAEYFSREIIACRDGTRSFQNDRLNDGFCDCPDGTDEPGTSACPEGRFYCRNMENTPHLLFSSRVNDHICDCCDGSDEYDSGIICPHICSKDSNIVNNTASAGMDSKISIYIDTLERSGKFDLDDLVRNLEELKIALIVELLIGMGLTACCLLNLRVRLRRLRNANHYTPA